MRLVSVKVKPGAKASSVTEDANGVIVVKVKARPVKGAANDELIKLLAYYFKTPATLITIVSGHTSRLKTIKIES